MVLWSQAHLAPLLSQSLSEDYTWWAMVGRSFHAGCWEQELFSACVSLGLFHLLHFRRSFPSLACMRRAGLSWRLKGPLSSSLYSPLLSGPLSSQFQSFGPSELQTRPSHLRETVAFVGGFSLSAETWKLPPDGELKHFLGPPAFVSSLTRHHPLPSVLLVVLSVCHNHCLMYFVQFSSCLNQEGKSNSSWLKAMVVEKVLSWSNRYTINCTHWKCTLW